MHIFPRRATGLYFYVISLLMVLLSVIVHHYRSVAHPDEHQESPGIALLTGSSPFCASYPTGFGFEYVASVILNETTFAGNTDFTGPGYYDYTAEPIPAVTAGSTIPVSVLVEAMGATKEYVKIWIDFDGNGVLGNEPNELVFDTSGYSNTPFTGEISIPTDAYNGDLYARLIMRYQEPIGVCGEYNYGNTMDFRIPVVGGRERIILNVDIDNELSANGTVTSDPAGINAATDVFKSFFDPNEEVVLTAVPDEGSSFVGWFGDIVSTDNPLTVTMHANTDLVARFGLRSTVAMPTVTTAVTAIGTVSAILGGNVTADGGVEVTARGVEYSTNEGFTPNSGVQIAATTAGTGTFAIPVSSLTATTIYYARAYAVNSEGTAYGSEVSFTTNALPAAPSAPDLDPVNDTGISNSDNVTKNTMLTVTGGGAVANATVWLYADEVEVGSVIADESGNWAITATTLEEGNYTLTARVESADGALGATSTGLSIAIDETAAVVTGVEDGTLHNEGVTPVFSEGMAILNDEEFTSGTAVIEEGVYTLVVTDAAGNETTVDFMIDKTAPVVTGMVDGASYNEAVIPVFDEGTATLNGEEFTTGVEITDEDEYTLVITDKAGNESTVNFVIDKTAPSVIGVEEGVSYNEDIMPSFNEGTATLNEEEFTSSTVVAEAGAYTLVVTDAAGNVTTVNFTVDKMAPQIDGVENGLNYENLAVPVFGEGIAFLNGKPYSSGTPITKAGVYELVVTDDAGNTTILYFVVSDLPGAPTGLQAIAGNKQVTLGWQAPAGELLPITDYVIQYSGDDGRNWTTAEHSPLTGTTAVVIGLDNNRTYRFRIAAVNEFDAGTFSKSLGGIIPTEPVRNSEGDLPEPVPGETVVITDGNVEAMALEVLDEEYLKLRGNGYALTLSSLGVDNKRIPIAAIDAVIRLVRGAGAAVCVSGSGFEPGTVVTVYLFSVPELVGHITVDEKGDFVETLPLPTDLELGRHTLQANGVVAGGGERSVSVGLLLVDYMPQKINFDELADRTYGDMPIKLEAVASSGLPVSYMVTNREGNAKDIATVTNGNELHLHKAGDVRVTAAQEGDLEYAPANPLVQTLHIAKAPLRVGVSDATRSYGETNPAFELTYSGFLNEDDVSSLVNRPEASTDAMETSVPGSYVVTAAGGESTNYAFTYGSATLTITKASQAITFNAPAEVNRDAGSIQLDVLASSGLPVSLSLDDEQVATLEGSTLNIHQLGTVTITATQAGDGNYESAGPVAVTIKVIDPSSDFAVRVHPAVSPNGDGINEFLMIEGIRDFPDNRVTVVSRNGTVVWEAAGYDNVNTVFRGTGAGGLQLAPGTYFYIVEIRVNGRLDYRKGYFGLRY